MYREIIYEQINVMILCSLRSVISLVQSNEPRGDAAYCPGIGVYFSKAQE